ncbi:DUF421 domain-containing protein [Kaistella jeonii]|uniref:Membrane protein n=1 Tax=Kaistella jeonii TaxID=266749 RepID=A0A0C1D2Q4_9FLAO|nr:YetF domain-containing protein [Kaistella jeonii]KIA88060.1 membrane protein [Kaistella jeonii]SFC31466.1 Uncharacterized membrane protein YcaP, DUF421 family [Kaistella jeonii]VEI95605.1 Protein of uncharacterised function (DUF421) [Kaistella jeonii]
MHDLLNVSLRSLAVYLFMFAGIRIFGKNQLSQLNAGDIVLLLLISNAVQNAMVGSNTSLEGGLMAALVLFGANFVVKKIIFKNPKIKSMIESDPVVLIKDGVVDNVAMKKEDIDFDELEEAVREHGVEKIEDVKLAVLEVDGNISVISMDKKSSGTNYSRHKRKYPRKSHRF